jgi:ABC-type amino acid transport system permease subunit
MAVLGPEAVATLTIILGVLFALLAGVVFMLLRISWDQLFHLVKQISSYPFSTVPLAILLWNCVAINFNAWQDNTEAIEAWTRIQSDSAHVFGIGTTLLAYASFSMIISATADLVDSVRERLAAIPRQP